jgi:CRP-like cAMP-binding protein
MARTVPATPRHASESVSRGNDGKQMQNEILLDLPREEWGALFEKLEFVRLKLHQIVHEAGEPIKSGYFCNSGMFSIVSVMPDSKTVEVGLIGREGFAGIPLIVGFRTSFTRTVVQAEGTAYRVDASSLRNLFRKCPQLERNLQRFGQLLGMQATQIATCNRLHQANERMARWLLMTKDRVHEDALPLTQEFLAQMLGSDRSTVTECANRLQKKGLISYKRGHITILNRPSLEKAACDCYEIMQRQTKRWQGQEEA